MEVIVPPHVDGAMNGIEGLFSFMHYSVEGGGPNDSVRRSNLSKIFKAEFKVQPDASNAGYVAEFGKPESRTRFEKMERFLDSNLTKFANKTSNAWLNCLEKWGSDYDWLIEQFGEQFGYVLG